jgi:hypothetical protein
MKIEILMSPGCGHGQRTAELIAEVVRQEAPGAEVATIPVSTSAEAARLGFLGSPTVRVDGVDIDPEPPASVGLG